MNKRINLKAVSDELGLIFFDDQISGVNQDWGLINGSPGRLEEFIDYFNTHKSFSEAIKYQFFELIIASCNEAILKNVITVKGKLLFNKFIQQHLSDSTFKPIVSYWKKITNEEDFPVGRLL